MNNIYLWCIAAITVFIGITTLWRLLFERQRLTKEDLSEEDRAFVWRVVIFLVFPLTVLVDLRTTTVVAEWFGGYLKDCTYGLLWYHAVPAGLPSQDLVIPVLFAGSLATSILALSLLPSLLFRPHPFLATLIGYSASFILAVNLIADPLLSLTNLGSLRWQLAMSEGAPDQKIPLVVAHVLLAGLYICALKITKLRVWFSELTRPTASEELREAISNLQAYPNSARLACKVGLLYDKAGLRRQAKKQLKRLQTGFGTTLYVHFLEALILYRRREYKKAKAAFIYTSDHIGVDGELKASLLAAAACSAFADNDVIGALNLSERALEFDDASLVARMVKVDVFLHQGKKEQAGEEILFAMHLGLSLDLENKVPLDVEKAYDELVTVEERKNLDRTIQATRI